MAAIRPGRAAAKKQAAAPAAETPAAPLPATPKQRSAMVPAIVVAIALLGAAFMLKGGSKDDGGATQASTTESSAVAAADGDVVALDPITMNLASGDILKVGIALQLSTTADAAKATADPAAFGARALDETISVLGQYTKAELAGTGKNGAKSKLSARVALLYTNEVTGVYFTQFVIP
jgi:flagellar FliL protein